MKDPEWVWLDQYLKKTGKTLPEAICIGYGTFALVMAMRLDSDADYIRAVAKANIELRAMFPPKPKSLKSRRRKYVLDPGKNSFHSGSARKRKCS